MRLLDEKMGGDTVELIINVKNGIQSDLTKRTIKLIKDNKTKVHAPIQGEIIRSGGTRRNDLQDAIALCKKQIEDVPYSLIIFGIESICIGERLPNLGHFWLN
jgi:cyclic-di-GMP-binding protein